MKKGSGKRRAGKRESRREHNPVETKTEEAARLANMLAPLEEQESEGLKRSAPSNGGAIVVDTARLNLPKDLIEEDEEDNPLGLERVVIFILLVVLAFIAFIAYLIYIEPAR
jgi:hypothetical protein